MDVMQLRRNLLLMPKPLPSGLPAEYRSVDYLESTGTQWIDTGYQPTANTSISLDYTFSVNAGGQIGLFGQEPAGRVKAEIRYGSRWYMYSPFGLVLYPQPDFDGYGVSANVRNSLIFNENGMTLNGTTVAPSRSNTSTTSTNIYLFALNNSGVAYEIANNLRVHSFKLFESGAIAYDLVPCIRISDNKPGMYDLVGRQFYANAGTGEFAVGYTMLPKYAIESDGRGKPSSMRIPVTAGQTVTIEYEGISDRSSGRFIYDGYFARNITIDGVTTNLYYCSMLSSNDGTIVLTTGRAGYISMLIGRNEAEGNTSQVVIKSVKIRVE